MGLTSRIHRMGLALLVLGLGWNWGWSAPQTLEPGRQQTRDQEPVQKGKGKGRGGKVLTNMIDPGSNDPAGAYIDSPVPPVSVVFGQPINFSGSTDYGITLSWDFGDGATATGASATHAFSAAGSYLVRFQASASGYMTSIASIGVTVTAPTTRPTINSFTSNPALIQQGGNSTLTWSVAGATSLSISPAPGSVTGTSTTVAPSATTTYTLSATNSYGTSTATSIVTVNRPPIFQSGTPASMTLMQGLQQSLVLPAATDPDAGDVLTYSVTGLPPGLVFTPSTRRVTGTPTTIGVYPMTYTVQDNRGGQVASQFTYTVIDLPNTTRTLDLGSSFSETLPAVTGASYSIVGCPTGMSADGSTRIVSGTPTIGGRNILAITLTNIANPSYTVVKQITYEVRPAFQSRTVISPTNASQTITVPALLPAQNFTVNQPVMLWFPDATNGDWQPISYSFPSPFYLLQWNTSTRLMSGTFYSAGTYTLTYRASNPQGVYIDQAITITVTADPALTFSSSLADQSFVVGTAVNLQLPSATGGTGALTYTLSGLPQGQLTFTPGTRTLSGTPTGPGNYPVSYTVTDSLGSSATLWATFTVSPSKASPAFAGNLPVTFELKKGTPTTLAAWPSATGASSYSVSGLPSGLSFNSTTKVITGTPTTAGTFPVIYSATDSSVSPALTTQQTTTFLVSEDVPTVGSFTAASTATPGQWTLSWNVTGATSVSIQVSGQTGTLSTAMAGSLPVTPSGVTTYLLKATNTGGSVYRIVTLAADSVSGLTSAPPMPNLAQHVNPKFSETLHYEWADANGSHRSESGLITAVDVNRQLQASVAGLTSSATEDQATQSSYAYGYDALAQLTAANGTFKDPSGVVKLTDVTSYRYDAHGNRVGHTPRTTGSPEWAYTYFGGTAGEVRTNQLKNVTGYGSFTYTADGAAATITRSGLVQTMDYRDPRFMRLPTRMVRPTSDGRTVESDLRYDMSGTRVYKRDFIHDSADATKVLSDRETTYLANGTEVLMEVEDRGPNGVTAADRYTAYIFGAGSRLARLSWDSDGRVATAGLLPQAITNNDFSNGTTGWTASNAGVGNVQDATLGEPTLQVTRTDTTAGPSFVEQSLGTTFPVGATVELSALVRNDSSATSMLGLYQPGAGDTPHSGSAAVRIGRDIGTNSSLGRLLPTLTPLKVGETWVASVWFKAPAGTYGTLYLGNSGGAIKSSKSLVGNGAWQQIVLTGLTNTLTTDQPMYLYIYGDKTTMNTDTRVVYDDVQVTNTTTSTSVFTEGFESGLQVTTSWSTVGWYEAGQNAEWVTAGGATQLIPISATSWTTNTTPYKIRRTLLVGGEVRAQLHNSSMAGGNLKSWFDAVAVNTLPAATTNTGKANYWPDPGFEAALKPDANSVDSPVGSVTLQYDNNGREGRKVLRVPADATTTSTYTRTITGLTWGKTYMFSVWKKPEGGTWTREIRTGLTPTTVLGTLPITLSGDGVNHVAMYYDQAELMLWNSGDPTPESWIPENRLGRVDWFITDHLGSTKLLIDQTSAHRFTGDDDPYGLNIRAFGDRDAHRYTGQILDDDQGLYYYGARFYLPEVGRFISGDPAHEFYNMFSYVGNKPTAMIDPSGEFAEPGEPNSTPSGGALSTGEFLDQQGEQAYKAGNYVTWVSLGFLYGAYHTLTPGGDSLSKVNARAHNGEVISNGELATTGGKALLDLALTAAPELGKVRGASNLVPKGLAQWYQKGSEADAAWKALSSEDKLFFEIGQNTLPSSEFERLASLDPVSRGRALAATKGLIPAMLPSSTGWLKVSGEGATLLTGPTPLFRLLAPKAAYIGFEGFRLKNAFDEAPTTGFSPPPSSAKK